MASGSVIAAVVAKYETLTAANFPGASRPSIWLDEAPQEDGSGGQLRPPWVIVRDGGGVPRWDTGQNARVVSKFTLEVYANTLADADTIMAAILWNGSAPSVKAGLAFATLILAAPSYAEASAVYPRGDRRSLAGLDFQAARMHKVAQDFEAITGVSA